MKKIIISVLLTSFIFNSTAYADWKQTKWGMTIAQVKMKCPDAKLIPEDEDTQYHYNAFPGERTLLVEDDYHVADMIYDVRYVFDNKGKLKAINMVGDQYNYVRTFNLLSGKYGQPANYSGNGGSMSQATWRVPEKHLMVKIQMLMHTTIRYEPINDDL